VKGFNSHGMVPIRGNEVTAADIDQVLEAARAVPLPADRHILHVLPKEYVVDDQEGVRDAQGMAGVRLEARVHVLTGSTPVVENVIKCCNRSGVTVSQVILAPLASAEAVLSPEERELGAGMIDIGGGTTDLVVYQAGSVQHTAVLPLGGNHITNDIAAGLQTPAAEAEKLKRNFGNAVSSSVRSDERIEVPSVGGRGPRVLSRQILAEIIEPRVEEMLSLVAAEISRAGVEGMLTSGVVLTGGAANLAGLVALAEKVLHVPVRVGSAVHSGGLGDIVSGPAYATGMGLLQLAGKATADSMMAPTSAGVLAKVKNRMGDWFREFF
jgi:cell division protein FtsA